MNEAAVRIGELQVRVPDISPEHARILGRRVADRVAQLVPEGLSSRRCSDMDIKVNIPENSTLDDMADMIAQSVIKEIM